MQCNDTSRLNLHIGFKILIRFQWAIRVVLEISLSNYDHEFVRVIHQMYHCIALSNFSFLTMKYFPVCFVFVCCVWEFLLSRIRVVIRLFGSLHGARLFVKTVHGDSTYDAQPLLFIYLAQRATRIVWLKRIFNHSAKNENTQIMK